MGTSIIIVQFSKLQQRQIFAELSENLLRKVLESPRLYCIGLYCIGRYRVIPEVDHNLRHKQKGQYQDRVVVYDGHNVR